MGLYIIFGMAMVVDLVVAYLGVGLVLAEFKGVYLPFVKEIIANGKDHT